MSVLLQFYSRALAMLVGIMVPLVLLLPQATPFLVARFGVSNSTIETWARVLILAILAGGQWLIRKWVWRIVHPELDFQGYWEGVTQYTHVRVGLVANLPSPADHLVKFEQDCLAFAIAPTNAAEFRNWGSLAINLESKDAIQYAYWVAYSGENLFPPRAIGYEKMIVTKRDSRGRPIELTGDFYHCAMEFEPVYSGTVTFKRKGQ